jgi:hypothetical protein
MSRVSKPNMIYSNLLLILYQLQISIIQNPRKFIVLILLKNLHFNNLPLHVKILIVQQLRNSLKDVNARNLNVIKSIANA